MRKFFAAITSVAILLGAFYVYSVHRAEEDQIVTILRENSFLPIIPSTADTVGTIYFVDLFNISRITQLCRTPDEISEKYMHESRSADVGGTRTWTGTLTSKLKAKSGQVINGNGSIDDNRSIKTSYELNDVHVYKIDAASGKELYDDLMNRPSCIKCGKRLFE